MISFEEFYDHLAAAPARVQSELHEVAVLVAEHAKLRAQDYIGHAQEGWAPLAESTVYGWDAPWGRHFPGKAELGFDPPDFEPLKRSGDLGESIQSEVEGSEGAIGSNDMVAVYQEMGTHRNGGQYVPPRPFLALAMQNALPDIQIGCGELAVRVLTPTL